MKEIDDWVRVTWLSALPYYPLSGCDFRLRDSGRPEIVIVTPLDYRNMVYDLPSGHKYIEAKK